MMTTKEKISVMQHYEAGGSVQVKGHQEREWRASDTPAWNFAVCDYRPAPSPVPVPLGPEDIKPGDVFRAMTPNAAVCQWTVKDATTIRLGITGYSYPYLMRAFEISRDGGKTWQHCHKEVAQ